MAFGAKGLARDHPLLGEAELVAMDLSHWLEIGNEGEDVVQLPKVEALIRQQMYQTRKCSVTAHTAICTQHLSVVLAGIAETYALSMSGLCFILRAGFESYVGHAIYFGRPRDTRVCWQERRCLAKTKTLLTMATSQSAKRLNKGMKRCACIHLPVAFLHAQFSQ